MTLSISQSATAVGAGITASFLASGGTAPYTYSVEPGGAGGSINASTGVYSAPAVVSDDPRLAYDTITVTDADNAEASTQILVGGALFLFCEIIQRMMNLANGRVYIWDQKIMKPRDNDLYVAVSVLACRPFGNANAATSTVSGMASVQQINMGATLLVDFISRGPAARERKEELLMALASNYSQQQQAANSFFIAQLPNNATFTNLSEVDGAAIPYRFQIPVTIHYLKKIVSDVDYFDQFELDVETDPQYVPPGPPLVNAHYYDADFDDVTSVDIDISDHYVGSHAAFAADTALLEGEFPSEQFLITRPTENIIRITTGKAFTGRVRLTVVSVPVYYDVVWAGETSKTIDVSGDFTDSTKLAVTDIVSLDGSQFPSEFWGVTRPTVGSIQISAGSPFTGTIRVAVLEGSAA